MTFTANVRLIITLSVLSLVACVGIIAYAAGESNGRVSESSAVDHVLNDCETYDEPGEDMSAILRSAGWTASALDGAERLYSPACDVPNEPVGYVEVAEDGSADHYLDHGNGNIEHDLTWPAGSFASDGTWYICHDLDFQAEGVCKDALRHPGAKVVR